MSNRTYKFRAWDKTSNIMRTDISSIDYDGSGKVAQINVVTGVDILFPDKEAILMQYTGLKDRHGVEIYEGDVVRSFSNINKKSDPHLSAAEPTYRTSSVEFYNGAFRLTCDEFPHGCGILNNYVGAMAEDLEVIGNVWEHKELLKEKQ